MRDSGAGLDIAPSSASSGPAPVHHTPPQNISKRRVTISVNDAIQLWAENDVTGEVLEGPFRLVLQIVSEWLAKGQPAFVGLFIPEKEEER